LAEYDNLVEEAQKAVEKAIAEQGTNMTTYSRSIGVNPGLMSVLMNRGKLRPSLANVLASEGLITLPPKPIEMTPATAAVILVGMEPRKPKRKRAARPKRAPRFAAPKDDPEKVASAVIRNMGEELAAEVAGLISRELQSG
jgi:hypothetical protein